MILSRRAASQTPSISRALGVLGAGGICVLGDEDGHADLVLAADHVDGGGINFLAQHGRGLICLALTAEAVDRLALPPMVRGWDHPRAAFTVSIEARQGITTGISARERAHTIRVAVDPSSGAADLVVPGHVFPMRARPGGLLAGGGRAEAALDLVLSAHAGTAAVFTQILDDDGNLADLHTCEESLGRLGLPIVRRVDLLNLLRGRQEAAADGPGGGGSVGLWPGPGRVVSGGGERGMAGSSGGSRVPGSQEVAP